MALDYLAVKNKDYQLQSSNKKQMFCLMKLHHPLMLKRNKIQETINYLTKDRTTLVIAHRLSTIINSEKFCYLIMVRSFQRVIMII